MLNDSPDTSALHAFLDDAHRLIGRAQECLHHFQLIGEDADASDCLIGTLASLQDKASAQGQAQIAGFCQQLCARLEPAGHRNRLHGAALGTLEACLCLLAWQVELIDPFTGVLNLDNEEQQELLQHLDQVLASSGVPVENA